MDELNSGHRRHLQMGSEQRSIRTPWNRRQLLGVSGGVVLNALFTTGTVAQSLQEPAQARLDQLMAAFLRTNDVVGGAVALVHQGRLIAAKGYGFADRDTKRPFEPSTAARIGSVSKPVTALAVLKLVADGKLRLDEPALAQLGLEPFPGSVKATEGRLARVTVRHLLQHTTGYDEKSAGNFTVDWAPVGRAFGVVRPSREQIVRYYLGLPRPNEPGKVFAYDNAGYLTLGRLIEKVSGKTYEEFVRQAVLQPLGILHMGVGARFRKDIPAGESTPYGTQGVAEETPGDLWESCGGWSASAVDLARLVRGLTTRQLLRILPQHLISELMRRPAYVSPDVNHYYGLGWEVDLRQTDGRERLRFSHSGSGGVGCAFIQSRWDGCTVCAVFNRDRADTLGTIWNDIGVGVLDAISPNYPPQDLFGRY